MKPKRGDGGLFTMGATTETASVSCTPLEDAITVIVRKPVLLAVVRTAEARPVLSVVALVTDSSPEETAKLNATPGKALLLLSTARTTIGRPSATVSASEGNCEPPGREMVMAAGGGAAGAGATTETTAVPCTLPDAAVTVMLRKVALPAVVSTAVARPVSLVVALVTERSPDVEEKAMVRPGRALLLLSTASTTMGRPSSKVSALDGN